MEAIYEVLPIGVGLLGLVIVNIVLGSCDAWIAGEFDKATLIKGIIKGLIIAACIVVAYAAGYLNQDIYITVNGESVTLMSAVTILMVTAYSAYAVQVIKKLYTLFNLDTSTVSTVSTSGETSSAVSTEATAADTETAAETAAATEQVTAGLDHT